MNNSIPSNNGNGAPVDGKALSTSYIHSITVAFSYIFSSVCQLFASIRSLWTRNAKTMEYDNAGDQHNDDNESPAPIDESVQFPDDMNNESPAPIGESVQFPDDMNNEPPVPIGESVQFPDDMNNEPPVPIGDNVDALIQRYQGLIECKDIGNGEYELGIVGQDILNEKAQEILEVFENVNVVSFYVNNCNNLTQLIIGNFPNLTDLKVSCPNLTQLIITNSPKLTFLNVSCPNLTQLIIQNFTNLKTLIVSCPNLTQLNIPNSTKLGTLIVSGSKLTQLNIPNSTKLETLVVLGSNITELNIPNSPKLEKLKVFCRNLHGELDVSGSPRLDSIDISNCADDFVVVISPECPLAQRLQNNHPHIRIKGQPSIQPSINDQYTSFLSKDEDKHVVQRVINLVCGHNRASNAKKMDCLNCLKSYCERYVNASEEEKARAAEKYISALTEFRTYMNTCSDAFATGLAKLKIELELGDLLNQCNTAKERRQVLFGVYAQEQIERSIGRFDGLYTKPNGRKVGELLELQLALNIVFNVPYSENMAHSACAAEVARAVTGVYNGNVANGLRDLVVPGETFLKAYDGISDIFLEQAQTKLRLDENDAKLFEVPLKIVLSSMLRDDAANENFVDRKFNTFLLGEQEYWSLAAETPDSIYPLTVGELEQFIGETDDTRAIKAFIQEHKGQPIDPNDAEEGKLSGNSTLANVFNFLENNSMEDNELYGKIADMTSPAGVARLQQQSIGNLYYNDVYETKLAEHIQNALVPQQQQVWA